MTPNPEFFAADDTVAALEITLSNASGVARLPALIAVAWQMRQRDTPRALSLLDEAELCFSNAQLGEQEHIRVRARLQLIRAEAKWLIGEIALGKTMAEGALHDFDAHDAMPRDALGCADAHWLLAEIADDQGEGARRNAEHEAMAAAAFGIDPVRTAVAQAAQARFAAFRDVAEAKKRWVSQLPLESSALHPAIASAFEDCLGLLAGLSSDYVESMRHWSNAYPTLLASGQKRRAMIVASNIGESFSRLNDHHAALEWMQRALDLARPSGWTGMIGLALTQTANTLRGLKHFDAAADLLREALTLMATLSTSRHYAHALDYLGEVELDRKRYTSALDSFHKLEQLALSLAQVDHLSASLRGQARALFELGQPEPALKAAKAALAAAKSDAGRQISALRVIADIHSRHTLPAPPDMRAISAPLHYLQQALDAAATIENYTVPGDLLETVASEYAKIGDTGKAYEMALQANNAREKIHSQEAGNRASAIQLNHETEKTRAESEHQRQLAVALGERAATLELANATLEQLGAVGRDITGNLDATAIFTALDTHVHALLDATAFLIYRLETDEKTLKMVFGIEAGQAVPSHVVLLDDNERNAARSARERQEVIINLVPGQEEVIAGTLDTLSLMFAPLMVGERLLGVMTIQSTKPHAYHEREVAIFRTLCAYGAIALDKAAAYADLKLTQAKLVEQQKLAALGSIVAGVAHELNTPIGNSLLMASSLKEETERFAAQLQHATLKRSEVDRYCQSISQALEIILRNLGTSAELVSSFKEISVDQTSSMRRKFSLLKLCEDVAMTLDTRIRREQHKMTLDIDPDIQLDSFPGPLGQVLSNLVLNALIHGLANQADGLIEISAHLTPQQGVQLRCKDNGKGITEKNIAHVFEPFFTTRLGKGGSGLGLHICYNIVTGNLGGTITVASVENDGTCFTLDLPIIAPENISTGVTNNLAAPAG